MNPRPLAALLLPLLAGCPKRSPSVAADAAGDDVAVPEAGAPAPRCAVTGTASVDSLTGGQEVDLENGIFGSDAAWVPLLRMEAGERRALVARLGLGSSVATVLDLGLVAGDVSAPTLFLRESHVFAVARVKSKVGIQGKGAGPDFVGRWTLFQLGESAEPLVTLTDTSAPFPTIAACASPAGSSFGAALAWDEDRAPANGKPAAMGAGAEPPHGAVRVAFLTPSLRSVARLDTVSPETSDASSPKIVARPGGYWVAWLARKNDPKLDSDADLEGPGEERAYLWVEVTALDAQGKVTGPLRRVTPSMGHVSGFEMTRDPGSSRLDLYVAMEDEREPGAGGSVVHVVVTPDAASRVSTIVADGMGRGGTLSIDEVRGRAADLLYVGSDDHLRVVSLNGEGDADGLPSLEPSLDDLRPLMIRRGNDAVEGVAVTSLATSAPGKPPETSKASPLRWISCTSSR